VRHQIIYHYFVPNSATSESTVGNFHKLYGDLEAISQNSWDNDSTTGGTINEFSKKFILLTDSRNYDDFEEAPRRILKGYLRGRVCYKSPPLSSMSDYFTKYTTDGIPELTTRIKLQINFICNLQHAKQAQHPHVTNELDVLGDVMDYSCGMSFKNHQASRLSDLAAIEYLGPFAQSIPSSISTSTISFQQLLHTAHLVSPKSNCVLAFEENGLIFFAPEHTRVGDLVCQFSGSDILCIFQCYPRADSHKFANEDITVYRAVNFLAAPSNMAVDICGQSMSFENAEWNTVIFSAGLGDIERLCRVSKSPNGEHNILNPGDVTLPLMCDIESRDDIESRENVIGKSRWI
jgi:hypothetical protein